MVNNKTFFNETFFSLQLLLATVVFVLGVRTFTPRNASTGFLYIGGPAVALSLVAMALDDGSLYAAVKVLVSVLETNSAMQQEMNRINGYKVCPTTAYLHSM